MAGESVAAEKIPISIICPHCTQVVSITGVVLICPHCLQPVSVRDTYPEMAYYNTCPHCGHFCCWGLIGKEKISIAIRKVGENNETQQA